jgi:hypothetical protein
MKYIKYLRIKSYQFDLYVNLIKNQKAEVESLDIVDGLNEDFFINNIDKMIEIKDINLCISFIKKYSYLATIEGHIEKINNLILSSNDSEKISKYVIEALRQPLPEAEEHILKNPENIFHYVRNVIKKRWPKCEEKILKNIEFTFYYYTGYVFSKDPNFNQEWKEGENLIASNPEYAFKFAKFKRERWIKGEKAILKNPEITVDYVIDAIGKRFPEFEDVILKDSQASYKYYQFIKRLGEKWEQGIKIISKDPKTSISFATYEIKGRFIEGENSIAGNPYTALEYAKNYFKGIRWIDMKDIDPKISKKAERNIFNNTYTAANYISYFIKDRIKHLENFLSKNGYSSYLYAYSVFRDKNKRPLRWIQIPDIPKKIALEAERNIIHSGYGIDYAKNVIQDEWLEAGITFQMMYPDIDEEVEED